MGVRVYLKLVCNLGIRDLDDVKFLCCAGKAFAGHLIDFGKKNVKRKKPVLSDNFFSVFSTQMML
jgi:hypothetical protein